MNLLKMEKLHLIKMLRKIPIYSWPGFIWMIFFIVIPMGIIVLYSFLTKGTYGGIQWQFTIENFSRSWDGLYLSIFWVSFELAALTTLSCAVLGFPLAYTMATASQKWRTILLILLVIPFWTNFVVRTYAIKLLFSDSGPLAQGLAHWGWSFSLSESPFLVWIGMVTNYLPFFVLPLYTSIEKLDFSLLEAGRDLGASGWSNFWRVLLPLCKPGFVTGSILVFAPALGEFLIPDLLGGAKVMLIGNLVTEQFLKTRDWPFGSALSVVLIAAVVISLLFAMRFWIKEEKQSQNKDSMAA